MSNQKTAHYSQYFRDNYTISGARHIIHQISQDNNIPCATPVRVYVLRSFTIEPIFPIIQASLLLQGVDLKVEFGGFNAYVQEILDPRSALYRSDPQIVVLAMQARDVMPEIWSDFADLSREAVDLVTQRVVADLQSWISAFRSRSSAQIILQNFEVPPRLSQGILDHQTENSQQEAIRRVNEQIARVAREHSGVYLLDYDGLIARCGRERWHDEKKWLIARMPISAEAIPLLASEYAAYFHALSGKTAKALVVDLDNTLWGGVIGEEGMSGIQLSSEYPGAPFRALQRAILDLSARGILLAISSKNNPADAMEALEKHPGMLLRPAHFAAMRINWNDKAQSLREIARELNIGVDALAFLDDNPVERERIRTELPEVTVIDLPADPIQYARALRDSPAFGRLSLSTEDKNRTRIYEEQRKREEQKSNAGSLEDYYYSLEMTANISPANNDNKSRISQLTQKTNQFNLTTRRYSESDIDAMISNPEYNVVCIKVQDRFGDNGIVGVAITKDNDNIAEIDTFLLSCRVIGRTVETAMLTYLADQARSRGMRTLRGWYIPTEKNAPCQEFYKNHEFEIDSTDEHRTLWKLNLEYTSIKYPEWITIFK